jgi:4-hydroxy-2-oxoheptanedioate aldolase
MNDQRDGGGGEEGGAIDPIRARWQAGRSAIVGWLHIPSPFSAEAVAHCGCDGLVIDLQHGPADTGMAADLFRAIRTGGGAAWARLQQNDPGEVMKLLDMGAQGLICPMIDTPEDAAAFAQALHYPPRGTRSYGPRRPLLEYGPDYWRRASSTFVSMAMVETRTSLENLDAILEVDGIDGIFVGPADLALSLGCAPRPEALEPMVDEAIAEIRSRTQAVGRRAGIFCGDTQQAKARLAEGFDLVTIQPDLALLTDGVKRAVAALRPSRRGMDAPPPAKPVSPSGPRV